jgi:hypothetical protein
MLGESTSAESGPSIIKRADASVLRQKLDE